MNLDLTSYIQPLNGDLSPIRALVERIAESDANVESKTGALRLSHRPKIGTEAYACVVYPGLSCDLLDRYEAIHRKRIAKYLPIPPFYRNVLTRMNGGFLFETSLFGIPLSMAQDPPLVARGVLQPLDICTANEDWRREYGVDLSRFYFASGSYSNAENVAYFLTPDNRVEAYLAKGKMIGSWARFDSFLAAEIERAEPRFLEYERSMERLRATSQSKVMKKKC